MNPFQKHGIQHLSPSSLNLWVENPGLWSLRYLAAVKEETGPAMARGKAVEDGMLHLLHGKTYEEALAAAHISFWNNTDGGIADEQHEAENALIPGMLKQCMHLPKPSPIIGSQMHVEHWFEGVSIPVIGYIDFIFECGSLWELKTTKACPSKPRGSHARQLSLYRTVRQAPSVSVIYVTEKRGAIFRLSEEDAEKCMSELHSAALSLQRFLDKCDDAEDAIRALPMNLDHYAFADVHRAKLAEMHL